MLPYSISLTGLLLLSCLIQLFIPPISSWYDARILLLPLILLCGSVTVSTGIMLFLAFLGGFLWDAQQVFIIIEGDPLVYHSSADSLKFGYSIILYTLMGFLMQGIRPLFREGNWYVSAALTGVALFLYLFVDYLLRQFVVGGFTFDDGMLRQIVTTSLLTMFFSPVIFWTLFRIADLSGHTIQYER